jgi:hypothetical protein
MYIRLIAIAGIAAAGAMISKPSRAASDDAALAACQKVFAAGLSTRVIPSAGYRITFANRGYVDSEAQYEAGTYTYDLVALDRRNGVAFAGATCIVDEEGAVTAMQYVPLTVGAPALASR